MRALHCPTRWDIIKALQDGSKSSDQIYNIIEEKSKMQKPAFYYHLRELEAVGIIGLDVCVSLKRQGYRVKLRKVRKASLARSHTITGNEAFEFAQSKLGVKAKEEE